MPLSPDNTHQLFTSRVKVPASTYVGQAGRMFYHENTGELRLSDGVTPGGLPIFFSGTGGNSNVSNQHGSITVLNYAQTGPSTTDIGLVLNRGTSGNTGFIWDESVQAFRFINTPNTGYENTANVTISNNAPIISGTQYIATGNFVIDGDAQSGVYVQRNVTPGTAITPLYTDGVAQELIVGPNSIWTYDILLSAKRTNGGNDGASFRLVGAVGRGATPASVFMVGNPSLTVIGQTDPNWTADTAVNTATGALVINVTGGLGKTVRWVAKITTTEVAF